jgi:acetyl-CoA C-acetyltransferase
MVLTNEATAAAQGLNARARIVGYAGFAQEPAWFTTAPVPATQKLLAQIGWSVADVDLFEVNEAFAVVPMAFMKELGIEHERMNVNGGACALGHPIGTSGTRIIVTLLNALEQCGLKRGVAAICIGGGEGTAIAIERL